MGKTETGHRFNFQPSQIVYLEHDGCRLYGEVVQIVETRQVCWVRPLGMMADTATTLLNSYTSINWVEDASIGWTDLRQGSDLLLPLHLFQPALDVDILPLLTYLYSENSSSNQEKSAKINHQKLNEFINQLWTAFPESFRNKM